MTLQILETLVRTYKKDCVFQQSLLKLVAQLKVDFCQVEA